MKKWRLICDTLPHNGFYNMAVDEALAISWTVGESIPVLRIYQWQYPVLTIGYGQREYSDMNIPYLKKEGIALIRRVTGGRGVLHGNDLTYSVIAERKGFFPDSITGSNKLIQNALLDALIDTGVQARTARSGKRGEGAACFSASSLNEITADGKKISGSAQRRLKNSFIQHGSILLSAETDKLTNCFNYSSPRKKEEYLRFLNKRMAGVNDVIADPVNFRDLKDAVIRGAANRFQTEFVSSTLTGTEEELVKSLESSKRAESSEIMRL